MSNTCRTKWYFMGFNNQKLASFSLMILLCFGSLDDAAKAQNSNNLKLDPARVTWTDLSFQAKNFWVEVSTDVQLRSLAATELDNILPAASEGEPIKPLTAQAAEMTIHTSIEPRVRSAVTIDNRIWFNPTDASALGRIRLRRGEDDFKKMYRFTRRGVFRHQIEPKDKKEALLAPENWTQKSNNFYAYDAERLGCSGVTERSLPVYILSAVDISKIDYPISLCVFGKRQLHRVQLKAEGTHRVKADYYEKSPRKKVRVKKEVEALKIAFYAEPMKSDLTEPENFSFLGFHKDIAIYIDPASRIPVLATGVITGVGKVELKLREVGNKNPSD